MAPAAALAADWASGEGSLVVSDGNGTIIVQGRGLIFGQLDEGAMIVIDYRPDDPTASIMVNGAKVKSVKANTPYAGSDMRFLFPSGRYTLELIGNGIAISAVGRGNVSVTGAGTGDDGTFTANGGKPQTLPKSSAGLYFGRSATP